MKVKALISFSGALSMRQGEVRDIENKSTLKNLLKIKYIEEVKEEKNKEKELQEEIERLKSEIKGLKKVPDISEDKNSNGEAESGENTDESK